MSQSSYSLSVDNLLREAPTPHFSKQVQLAGHVLNSDVAPVLLFGTGRLGRKVLVGLRSEHVAVCAFIDNNPRLAGQVVEGVPVLNSADAARTYGSDGVVVIAIWHAPATDTMQARVAAMRAAGFRNILPFYYLFWLRRALFLPHWSDEAPNEVRRQAVAVRSAAALFEDQRSRQEFVAQLHWRLDPEAEPLETIDDEAIYFGQNLYHFRLDEAYVDCGGCDGDTLKDFYRATNGRFSKAIVFEPDPSNFVKLNATVCSLVEDAQTRIRTFPYALGSRSGEITFADETVTSQISTSGGIRVRCEPLDQVLESEQATLIKMDIEGSEMDAIRGGEELIKRSRPVLAICLYHKQDDLWSIPLKIASLVSNYEFYLRTYGKDGTELVLYAVPRERANRN